VLFRSISGYITIYGSPLFSGGFVSGTVSCDRVVFGTVNGQITFSGTLSADGHAASGTYSAPSAPDSGTWTGAF